MTPIVLARCPNCGRKVEVPYILLGTATSCPSCGETVVPEVPVGTVYPRTNYQISYHDFQQLVAGRAYKPAIGELLARWFDYELSGNGGSSSVRSRDGENIDLVELHMRIQEDPAKQQEIYRIAMALWR